MIGERLSQVFNEAGAFAADLFGVNAALCLAEGHDAYFHGRDGEFGALGAGRVLRQFGAQVRIGYCDLKVQGRGVAGHNCLTRLKVIPAGISVQFGIYIF